jgi:DNA polymerase III delta subunit
MPAFAPPPAVLYYGNQGYSIEEAAAKLTDRVLGHGPRDFIYQRFDAAELLKAGGGEAIAARIDAFEEACHATPLLGDRRVVRLDHLEAVRVPDRAGQALQRALEAQKVCRVAWNGKAVWVAEADVEPEETVEETRPLAAWVESVQVQFAGPPLLRLRTLAGSIFAITRRGKRTEIGLAEYLQAVLKGKFFISDDAMEQTPSPSAGAGRLHNLLEGLLVRPPAGLTLILTAQVTRETDLPKPLLSALSALGAPVEKFVTYDDYNPADWVLKQAASRELRLTRSLAEALIERVGNELGRLAQELDRLALVFPAGKSFSKGELLAAVHGGDQFSVFQIGEHLGRRDLDGALLALRRFLEDSPHEHPVLIGHLARHFRQLALVHDLARNGVPDVELPGRLKLHPFITKKVVAQARRFSPTELDHVREAVARIDVAAKRHAHLTEVLLQDFFHQVCRGGFQHPLGNGTGA